ncbi:MAG: hypothetical protein EB084_14035 [Proteobacteria bacterium]|nr:hypothetical protein [Pseudomonadota bacterium]
MLVCLAMVAVAVAMRAVSARSPFKPRYIVMVSIDTCRADHLGAYGYGRPTSPSFDRIARQGTLFTNAFSQSDESLFSYGSILTGRYPGDVAPLRHATYRVPADVPTLASRLQAHGVPTAAYVAGGHLSHQYGFSRGFDTYRDEWSFGSFRDTVPKALERLEQAVADRTGLFLFVQGYDLHDPYHKPEGFDRLYDADYQGVAETVAARRAGVEWVYRNKWYAEPPRGTLLTQVLSSPDTALLEPVLQRFERAGASATSLGERDLAHLTAVYDASVTYADLWLGVLAARIEKLGIRDETLLIVFGDHGEELGERGVFGHRGSLVDTVLHVPLAFWGGAEVTRGRSVSSLVELRSLLATVADYAGVAVETTSAPSLRSLVNGESGGGREGVVSQAPLPGASVRDARHRLVFNERACGEAPLTERIVQAPIDAAHFSLYDEGAGAGETRDLVSSAEAPQIVERLRRLLIAALKGDQGR